jgi:site-specific recombinase XerD
MSLLQAYEYHVSYVERLLGIEFAYNTLRRYSSSLNSLKRFLNGNDIKLSSLEYKFVSDYYFYLLTTEKLQPNSAFKNIKALNKVIHVCMLNNWLTTNPFRNFHCRYKNPIRSYLTENEINTLYQYKFPTNRLTQVRDAFIFQVYTGLSYVDILNLTQDNIEIGVDVKQWIVIYRKKTGTRSAIPILPTAKEILIKYDYTIPVCSNQKMNEYLKEIGKLCNISKKLTTHIGRHTFATTICLGHGIPIETVSRLLGHTDIKTTQIYAKVTDTKVADDMRLLMK